MSNTTIVKSQPGTPSVSIKEWFKILLHRWLKPDEELDYKRFKKEVLPTLLTDADEFEDLLGELETMAMETFDQCGEENWRQVATLLEHAQERVRCRSGN